MSITEPRDTQPRRFHVSLSGDARFQIGEETTRRRFKLGSGYETAGVLFGDVGEASAVIEVVTGPGRDFRPERGEVNLNFADILGDEQARVLGNYVCGSWHTHPAGVMVEPPKPSDQDRRHWRYLLERPGYRGDAVVGLIVTEGRSGGWCSPRAFAWVTRRRDGMVVTERAGEISL